MGAYENPIPVIDTRSGEAWVNTLNNISRATTNYIDFTKQKDDEEIKRYQKILDDATSYALNKQDKVYDNLLKLKADPQLYNLVDDLLAKNTKAYLNAKNSSTAGERQKFLKEQSSIQKQIGSLYGILQAGIESDAYYLENVDPTTASQPNGISLVQKGMGDYLRGMNVRSGISEGSQKYSIDPETGEWIISITDKDGTIRKPADVFFNYTPIKIADINTEIKDLFISLGILEEDGQTLGKNFQETNKNKWTIDYFGNKQKFIIPANTIAMANAAGAQLNAKAQALFSDPNQAEAIWAIIRDKNDPERLDVASLINSGRTDAQKLFIERFNEYAYVLAPKGFETNWTNRPKPDRVEDFNSTFVEFIKEAVSSQKNTPSEPTVPYVVSEIESQTPRYSIKNKILADDAAKLINKFAANTNVNVISSGELRKRYPTAEEQVGKDKAELYLITGYKDELPELKPIKAYSAGNRSVESVLLTYRSFLSKDQQNQFDDILKTVYKIDINKKNNYSKYEREE